MSRIAEVKDDAQSRLDRARQRSPLLDHLIRTMQLYSSVNGSQQAGAITYYGFLSFFPILAVAFFIVGQLARIYPDARADLITAINQILPGVIGNGTNEIPLSTIESAATTVGALGVLVLMYSGLGWLSSMRSGLLLVFGVPKSEKPNWVIGKLRDLSTLAVIGFVLVLSVAVSGVVAALSRNIYVQTPSHVMANHQCNVRFAAKLRFLVGIASLVTRITGARDIPVVRETLGRLAASEAGYNAMIDGQIEAFQKIDLGYVLFNRRYLYAALHWAMDNHSSILDAVRELMGGGHFQFPASIDVLEDPELKETFETLWTAGPHGAVERMKLFKLAWDLIGSDHASRATSYEKLFVGPTFAVRHYNFVNAPWDELHAIAEGFMATYGVGANRPEAADRHSARIDGQ